MSDGRSPEVRETVVRRSRKLREMALIIPVIGILVFVTPMLDMFGQGSAGLGTRVLYIFGLWFVLILCAFLLSRRLKSEVRDR